MIDPLTDAQSLADNWHYFSALILFKCGQTRVEITSDDIKAFEATFGQNACVYADMLEDRAILQLLTDAEVRALLDSVNAP